MSSFIDFECKQINIEVSLILIKIILLKILIINSQCIVYKKFKNKYTKLNQNELKSFNKNFDLLPKFQNFNLIIKI